MKRLLLQCEWSDDPELHAELDSEPPQWRDPRAAAQHAHRHRPPHQEHHQPRPRPQEGLNPQLPVQEGVHRQ